MAKKKAPNTYNDFMQMFAPENLSKAFDPAAMMESFGVSPDKIDPQETIKKAQGQFEAMTKANEAAAQSYRDLMEKQMSIFKELTTKAAEQAKAGAPKDVPAAYQEAVGRALEIMTELSEATRDANTQAYDAIKGQVEDALKDLKS